MPEMITRVGLRIDVDTLRGTRQGVPRLLTTLARHKTKASFFFTVGPDNMGRHLWRLLKPAFFIKMLRSKAASLYGWDILLAGTFWPGRKIGQALPDVIRATQQAGHEVGLHAWDHYKWQTYVENMSRSAIKSELQNAYGTLKNIMSAEPGCSAAAGWKCTDDVLLAKEEFSFRYNSDGRGHSIFRPVINGFPVTPQIPVTLPTYDELIGRDGVNDANYNDVLLDMIQEQALNVLTIHAEVEGIICADMFDTFLTRAQERDIHFVPLVELLPDIELIPTGKIKMASQSGREGKICIQDTEQQS